MKIKNKLLLLSLMGMLGTSITGCGSSEKTRIVSDRGIFYGNGDLDNDETQMGVVREMIPNPEGDTTYTIIFETSGIKMVDPRKETMDIIRTGQIQKVYYATKDVTLTIPAYLKDDGKAEYVVLPKLECVEVYDQVDDICLVKTDKYIGYVSSLDLEELLGTFVVVDISNQELKLYSDNEVILTSPVVTGKPSSPTDQGIFEIYDISGPRYLIGSNYKTYVDTMMKYNGNEGLHDAEYHQHEDGFKHGWRDISEFGGETYLTNGSHGCVNMPHEEVMAVKEYVEIGTKVLVKQ